MTNDVAGAESGPWYRGVTAYEWLVLALASAGWIFDVYEGQIYNLTSDSLLKDIMHLAANADDPSLRFYDKLFLAIFLFGGTVGGIGFGSLADRWGRRPTLLITILMYSVFSGLTYFAQELWQVGLLRFLIAAGVGGEWSVAAAFVAEVFPMRARPYASSIFQASSILGTWLAALAAWSVGAEWRYVYLIGVLPALLIVVIRLSVTEPKKWVQAGGSAGGSVWELLAHPVWRKRAILGLFLAAVGLGTFWGVTIKGQQLAKRQLINEGVPPNEAQDSAKLAYGIVETTGGGLGLLAFGPLSMRWGRRRTFMVMHLAALIIVPITCYAPTAYWQLLVLLPFYGFFTLGIHAGYAVYFPELFPTRLRATGSGFCFSGGRCAAGSVLILAALLELLPAMQDIRRLIVLLSGLFLFGILFILLLPETKGQPLPE